ENYAWIGMRAMILPGVTIGEGAVVATLLMGAAIWLILPVLQSVAPGGPLARGGAAVVLLGAAVVGAGVFGGAALLLRLVGRDELALVRKALRRGAA
ncbi:MAG TPA: hypothetical protein VFM49_09195, partial [Chloroflexia bacterium]|nr:hypothetical protein [Chloroflexia bacterium]